MPVLNQEERDALRVEHFIFHVVHHGGDEPILFESTPIGDFERFFVGRIVDTLSGNRFVFAEGSETHAALWTVEGDPTQFVEVSKSLARRFHRNDGRFQRGILIVTALRAGDRRFHSLIKYDHERMVAFDMIDAGEALRDVVNGLTESRKALQKSALIELVGGGRGDLVVVDRSKPTGITDFFRDFLQAERLHGEDEMTATLAKALVRTVRDHAEALPVAITAQVRPRLVEIARQRPDFEPDVFFADFFGVHGSEAVRAGFNVNLARLGLDGESFTFDPAALPAVGQRRFRTREGVSIVVPEQAIDTVAFEPHEDGSTVVRIRTGHVTER